MLPLHYDTIDGRRLRMTRAGSGPPLLLLHGYPDTLQFWSALAPRLSGRYEVIAFDWPGIGESEVWPGGATPFDLARRVAHMLDAWKIERATIVGHDMGGQAALAMASLEPSRVARVVVMNSLLFRDQPTSWEISLLRRFRINQFLLRSMPRAVFHRAVASSLAAGERLPEELREELWLQFRKPEARRFIVRMCAGYEGTLPRLASLYAGITVPTSIIWGERDRHFPPAHGRRLNSIVAQSTFTQIEGGEHWMA